MKNYIIIPALATLIFLSSCGLYRTNVSNVPLLKEKGDIMGSASLEINFLVPTAYDFQGAYAVTDKIGLLANFTYYKGGTIKGLFGEENPPSGFMFEPGIGTFKSFGKKDRGRFEVYGLIGTQQIVNHSGGKEFSYSSIRPTAQFNLGASFGNIFDIAISSKFGFIHYYNHGFMSDDPDNIRDYGLFNAVILEDRNTFGLVEPAFTMRLGFKYIKIQAQAVMPFTLAGTGDGYFNLGLTFNIPSKSRRKTD